MSGRVRVGGVGHRGTKRHAALAALALALVAKSRVAAATDASTDGVGPTAPFHERVVNMPGDPRRLVNLEVTIMTPEGPGPYPLAVMNHGSPQPGQSRSAMPRYDRSFAIDYFLSRGYAVVMPMQRGFSNSGGDYESHGCDIERVGIEDARDILAVIGALRHEPDIDASRIVVAGISFGGWNTLAVGTLAGTEVKGLVNFSGGMRASDCDSQDRALMVGAQHFGSRSRAPSIWLYGENDSIFSSATWRTMYDRYTKAGGVAELFDFGIFGGDAHKFLSSGDSVRVWAPKVDAFLQRIGMPSAEAFPAYLPPMPPAPSHFARIDDFEALPLKNEKLKVLYKKFLTSDFPRAFVISSQTASEESGGFDPVGRALASCRKAAPDCAVYAYDDDVVWKGPAVLAPRPNTVVATVATGTTATLMFAVAVNPDCTSKGLDTVRIMTPPAHGVATVVQKLDFGHFDPQGPYAACNATKTSGMAVTYTPPAAFIGEDALAFEVINLKNQDRVVHVRLIVK